jgi:hypothetical protein
VELIGPGGLLTGLTKIVLETALGRKLVIRAGLNVAAELQARPVRASGLSG